MANENDIAILTDRVAQAMNRARSTLDNVADSLQDRNYGRVLEYRLDDVAQLQAGGERVQQAEDDAEKKGQRASLTKDRGDMARWHEADDQVRISFNSATQDAGNLGSRIGKAQGELDEFRDELARSSAFLDQALGDVDTLEQFPEYGTEAADELRTRVTHLKDLTTQTDGGLKTAYDRLGTARSTAFQLEQASLQVGDGAHSTAIQNASTSVTTDVKQTREGLTDVREGIDAQMYNVHEMAQYGIDEANRAAEEASRAAEEANRTPEETSRAAELAHAMRAGMNPTTSAEQSGDRAPDQQGAEGNAEQEHRLRVMRGLSPQSGQER